jgi:hypothetical protein
MGHGLYSFTNRKIRSQKNYDNKNIKDIFKYKNLNKDMDPSTISFRESRDSDEHPNSIPIIIGLDVTGSMGTVPHHLIKNGLPNMISNLIENNIQDAQILFMGIGDHKTDSAPLQVSQFESSDNLLDKWLTSIYIEGRGGRNGGESYMLAWYFASKFTKIDSYEKRNKKGYLFTIGDEPVFDILPKSNLKKIFKTNFKDDISNITFDDIWSDDIKPIKNFLTINLLNEAKKLYNIYHIHVKQTKNGKIESTIEKWKNLIGNNNLLIAEKREDIPNIISNTIINN